MVVIVAGIALMANGNLLQGRVFKSDKPLPAYDETKVKRQTKEKNLLPAYDETKDNYKSVIHNYYLKNNGKMDCSNQKNTKFCSAFEKAEKYYGYGEYNLNAEDFVIIPPFILRWSFPSFNYWGEIQVFWVNSKGEVLLLNKLSFSPYSFLENSIQVFQNIYFITEIGKVSDKKTNFIFTNDLTQVDNWAKKHSLAEDYKVNFNTGGEGEVKAEKGKFVGYIKQEFSNYNNYLLNSFDNCLPKVEEFLGLKLFITPVMIKFLVLDDGGGVYAGSMADPKIVGRTTPEYIDLILNGILDDKKYSELVAEGKCVHHAAQAHELTHIYVSETPLETHMILNEGLATYAESKLADDDAGKILCLEDGIKYSFSYGDGNMFPYCDLSSGWSGECYATAACIWDYIDTTYGHEKFLEIIKKLDDLRFEIDAYDMFKDIINPIVGEDLFQLFHDKFNLPEDYIYDNI